MNIIDGLKTSKDIKAELKLAAERLSAEFGRAPGLAAILVGDNPASRAYVNAKHKDCQETGFYSIVKKLDQDISESELLKEIEELNNNDLIDGILVQLPIPRHIDENRIIEAIDPKKDVDGFHPVNVGNLVIGKDTFAPCTPYGVLELLKRYNIETKGRHVVVVGRSNIVGKPVANMLLQKKAGANAVVTVCHSAAPDLKKFTLSADILIAAIGVPEFITGDMVSEGAVVIDVGINRVDDSSLPKGYRLTGDVDFNSVAPKCSFITPVPGGVGPMTRAMLLVNTFEAYKRKIK